MSRKLLIATVVALGMSAATAFAQATAPATDPAAAPAAPAAAPADPAAAPAAPADGTATPMATAPEAAGGGAPAAITPETEQVENPYGLKALWEQGDIVAKLTLIIMVIMSMGTWFILFTKLWDQQKMLKQAQESAKFWTAGSVKEGAKVLDQESVFRMLVDDGLKATEHHEGKLTDHIDLHEWVTMSLQRSADSVAARLSNGLSFLASVGSTSPFVGLFGTVWGIYHALIAIGISGQASIDKVAGPVGEALIMTAIGLGVAVPAVLGYNWLVRRNKQVMEYVRNFSSDLHSLLLANARKANKL